MSASGILRGGVLVAGVEVRILKGESHQLSNEVTQFGVESGKSLADHALMNPNLVDVGVEMPNSDGGADRARDVFQQFTKLLKDRAPLTLDTEHARYKNMVVAGFTPTHQAPFKGAFTANVRLQQVGIVGDGAMVEAAGGRSAAVLANDGTSKTAGPAMVAGDAPPIADPALQSRCDAVLENSC